MGLRARLKLEYGTLRTRTQLFKNIIYIYIYIYVCVCVYTYIYIYIYIYIHIYIYCTVMCGSVLLVRSEVALTNLRLKPQTPKPGIAPYTTKVHYTPVHDIILHCFLCDTPNETKLYQTLLDYTIPCYNKYKKEP